MPGYQVVDETIEIAGVAGLTIRRLKDKQQYADPQGRAEAQGISSAAWPLFGLLWPSGFELAAALARRPVLADEQILELGCGLALASLVGHRRGSRVTASDCHPLARRFLETNLQLNDLPPMRYRHGHWAERQEEQGDAALTEGQDGRLCAGVQGRFNLIIGSDVLYERDDLGQLPGFIAHHASATGEVLIVDPNRGNRSPFHRRMAALGYQMDETRLGELVGPVGAYRGRLFHYQRAG